MEKHDTEFLLESMFDDNGKTLQELMEEHIKNRINNIGY